MALVLLMLFGGERGGGGEKGGVTPAAAGLDEMGVDALAEAEVALVASSDTALDKATAEAEELLLGGAANATLAFEPADRLGDGPKELAGGGPGDTSFCMEVAGGGGGGEKSEVRLLDGARGMPV